MDWDHLRIVLAIWRRGSLQGAAETVGVDRATVVRRLDALEQRLGTRLFDRRHDGCALTDAGAEIIATVESIDRAVASLSGQIAGSDARAEGVVTVTMPEFMATNVFVPRLGRLREAHPGIRLEIDTGFDMRNLAQGQADIALRNRLPDQNSLVVRRLGHGGLAFYASHAYLDRHGWPESGFEGHDLALPPESALRLALFGRAAGYAEGGRVLLRVGDVATGVAAATSGVAIALLPCAAVIRAPDLVPLAPGIVAETETLLVTRRELRRRARVRAVIDFLATCHAEEAEAIAGLDARHRDSQAGAPSDQRLASAASMSEKAITGTKDTSASKAS